VTFVAKMRLQTCCFGATVTIAAKLRLQTCCLAALVGNYGCVGIYIHKLSPVLWNGNSENITCPSGRYCSRHFADILR
jgi:hypothetical protein